MLEDTTKKGERADAVNNVMLVQEDQSLYYVIRVKKELTDLIGGLL